MRRAGVVFSVILISLAIVAMTGWGALALYYSSLPDNVRTPVAFLFAFFGLAMLLLYFLQRRKRPILIFASAMAALLFYWHTIEPRQDRDWAPEYTRLAYATVHGDQVTIHSIRNFDYRTETDFTPGYYTKTSISQSSIQWTSSLPTGQETLSLISS
jgi:peptidoglycan/LPS O-acetylase OafA/YrhL